MNENNLLNGAKTSLIDKKISSNLSYQHQLLTNTPTQKIISTIRRELEICDEFLISVAFITEGGVSLLLEQLKNLENKNIKGKILTGDYLTFTQPKALETLMKFKNIELKILRGANHHAKGFFFKKDNLWNLIIGSSNLTQQALTINHEWNLKITSSENGKIFKDTISDFNVLYNNVEILDENKLEKYKLEYELMRQKRKFENINNFEILQNIPTPNFMQKEALSNLKSLRENNLNKALLISATGTGKTYLSAFDVKEFNPSKMLFIAHRKNILSKSMESFQKIIKNKKMEIYSGDSQSSDFIFAMVQTLNKKEHLEKFNPDFFDYIVIDEVHHSGADTYQNIINYFKPKFFLGMTATPERTDNFDIYSLFDHNIAYEIRLYDALKENLLCPFHYFGITDISVNGKEISDKTSVNDLVCDERVKHIIEKSKFYGYSGDTLHGLIFVGSIEEAKNLSLKLNERGLKTLSLTGDDSENIREQAISKLESGELNYIITRDIFNEGIDIPCVNQVILLRPTESAIIYIQQLGRGLRKNSNKEFVTILDFIGNYEKNFLIPTAISQNNSYDKDYLKRFLNDGTDFIPGESSIVFEQIAKEKIFENILKSNFSNRKLIEHDFKLLHLQHKKIPFLFDFAKNNFIEPSVILKYKNDYDEILKIFAPESCGILSEQEKNYLKFLSQFFTPAKRVHEFFILKYFLENKFENISLEKLNFEIENYLKVSNQIENTKNALKHLEKSIFTSYSTIKSYLPLIQKNILDEYNLISDFRKSYEDNLYFKNLVDDLINYNLYYVEKNYKQENICPAIIKYKSYTKEEAHKYLNLDYNNGLQVSGYNVFKDVKKVTIFITLDDSSSFTSYDNEFLDSKNLVWFSKNSRVLSRKNVLTDEGKIAENFYTLEIFIKKTNSENFYYVGQVSKVISAEETLNSNKQSIVKYSLELKEEIEHGLFEYLVSKK